MKRILPAIGIAVVGIILGYVFGSLIGLRGVQGVGFLLAGLAFGLVLGFILDWLIEEAYRRNRDLERQLETAQRLSSPTAMSLPATADNAESRQITPTLLADFLHQRDDEIKRLRAELGQAQEEVQAIQEDFETYAKTHPDDLTAIKGIGPVYQWKLRDIGVNTFQQLAQADADKMRRLLDIKNWQRVDVASWITQAQDWVRPG